MASVSVVVLVLLLILRPFLRCVHYGYQPMYVVYTTDGGRGLSHLRVSAGAIPVGNAIDVWQMCLRVTFSPPHMLAAVGLVT
jgi:hypothetical protein